MAMSSALLQRTVVERTTNMSVTIKLKIELCERIKEALGDWSMRAPPDAVEQALVDLPPEIPLNFGDAWHSCFALGFSTGRKDKTHTRKHRADKLNPFHFRRFEAPITFNLYDVWRFGYYVACYIKLPAARRTPTGRPKKTNGGEK